MNVNDNQKPAIRNLYSLQEELRRVKKLEGEARAEVIEMLLADDAQTPGTHNVSLGGGVKMTITVPKRIDVDAEQFEKFKGEMNQKGLIGETGVIKLKPSASITALKHMSDEDKVRYSDVFIAKSGAPSIKFDLEK